MRNQIIARLIMAFIANFIAIEAISANLGEFSCIPGALKEINLKELVGYSAKSLPPGLKLNKNTGFISGKATKPGTYNATFTKKNAETHTAKFTVEPLRTVEILMEGATDKCKVSGATKPNQGYLVGKSVMLSATCPKGTVFIGWFNKEGEVWPDKSQYLEPRLKYVVTEENLSLVARFEKETIKDKGSYGPYIPGTDVEESLGLVGYSVKNLPAGLKFDKKTGVVKGKPTKPGTYISTFTKQYLQTYTVKFIVDSLRTIKISMQGDTYQCKVSGATKPNQGHLVGKTVTLSATAPKGTMFKGWFKNNKPWPDGMKYLEPRLKHVVTKENLSLVALFEKEKMSVLCNGLLKPINAYSQLSTPIIIETMSGVKSVTATKLPTGLKVIKDKSTGMWYIQGNPKKTGVWNSTIKVTTNSGAVKELPIKITVNDGIIGGGNLTDANGYFKYGLDNGEGEKYVLSMDPSDIGKILPNLTLSSPSATLEVSGLPDGLTYDRTTGRINGTANKTGSYTVTLTVTDRGSTYISTITIIMGAPDNACDLLVSSITATRTAVYIGEKFNLRYVIKNDSKFDSQFFKNKIITSDGYNVIEHSCSGLAQKDTVAFRTQIDSGLLGVGKYVITILTDSNESNIESDETNNKKTITLEVLELPPTNSLVDWDFKAKVENEKVGAVFLSKASAPLVKASQFNRGEVIYAQINFWNNLHQQVTDQVTASVLLDTGVNTTRYWNYGLGVDVIGYIPDEHRRASVLQGLQPGVYTLEILLDSDRFVNPKGDYAYYPEADKLNNSEIIEFAVAGDNKVVTFDSNGGVINNNTISLTKGSRMGEMPKPTKKGYEFVGWYTAKESGVEITKETIISKDITVYARWASGAYAMRLHMNDGANGPETTVDQMFSTGQATKLYSIKELGWEVEGYKFAGWATRSGGDIKYTDGEKIIYEKADADGVSHLYAVWTYEVILHKNDGSEITEDQICRLDKDQSLLRITEDLEWECLTESLSFSGWATSPDGRIKYGDGATVAVSPNAVVELYAVWGGSEYIVRFHKSSDSTMTEDQIHTVGFATNLTTIAEIGWKIDGYQFAGWSTKVGGIIEFTDGQEVKDLKKEAGKVYDLYAVWIFKVVFHKADGSNETSEQLHQRGTKQKLFLIGRDIGWSVPGARFIGWATTEGGEVRYSDGEDCDNIMTKNSVIHLYAAWSKDKNYYVVEFHRNFPPEGGDSESITKEYRIGENITPSIYSEFVNNWKDKIEGYRFVGWAEEPKGEVKYKNGDVVVINGTEQGSTHNLYAVWKQSQYTIILHSNDGTGREFIINTNDVGVVELPAPAEDWLWATPTNAFLGWSSTVSKKASENSDITPNSVDFPDNKIDLTKYQEKEINLHAVWDAPRYAIMFHKNDGTGMVVTNTFVQGAEVNFANLDNETSKWPGVEGWINTEKEYKTKKTSVPNGLSDYIHKTDLYIDLYAMSNDDWYLEALGVLTNRYIVGITFSGDAHWTVGDKEGVNGAAMKSGNISQGQESTMIIRLQGPVEVSFVWELSGGRKDYDYLKFFVNDKEYDPLNGSSSKIPVEKISLSEHVEYSLKWSFIKDSDDVDYPGVSGWVDNLVITPISAKAKAFQVPNTANYAMRSTGSTTTTNASLFDSSRITGQFVEDFAIFELLLDDVNAVITSGRFTEYCEEGVITSECDVERVEEGLVLTQDNRIILIKISNGVATAEIIVD